MVRPSRRARLRPLPDEYEAGDDSVTDEVDWETGGTAPVQPATTVTDETTWGITPDAGTDPEYARGDHTHGSPDEPTGGGGGSVTVSDSHGTSVAGVTEIYFGAPDLWVTDMGGGIVTVDHYAVISYPFTVSWSVNGYNGVFRLMGLNAGSGTFTNPAGSLYTATQSTNLDGTRIASKATDGSSATESHTNSGAGEWWKADFLSGHTLTPTRLGIIGRDGGGLHPANFKLQGSNDNSSWTDLLTVTTSGIAATTWSSWAVTGSAAYRYIRILHSDASYLVLGDVEMWGTLG